MLNIKKKTLLSYIPNIQKCYWFLVILQFTLKNYEIFLFNEIIKNKLSYINPKIIFSNFKFQNNIRNRLRKPIKLDVRLITMEK
jgi:hypothetical protein